MNALLPAVVLLTVSGSVLCAQVVPTTPTKFDTKRIGDAVNGGGTVGFTPKQPQVTVKTTTHIVLGEPRQWKMADGKSSFIGKLIAFEDIVIGGTAAAPMTPPKNPTVVRNASARFFVNSKTYELALDKLGAEERKFIEDMSAAIAAKK